MFKVQCEVNPLNAFSLFAIGFIMNSSYAEEKKVEVKEEKKEQVVIQGKQTDIEASREFVAGKMIIGRARIEESGVNTVEELLRKEPAVTVSRDGKVGLLGMTRYTQILVDGKPPSLSQNITEMPLSQVEKIEIVKTSMAEFGPYSVAGTINIVSRKVAPIVSTDFTMDANLTDVNEGISFSGTHNWKLENSPWSGRINLSIFNNRSNSTSSQSQTHFSMGKEFFDWSSTSESWRKSTNAYSDLDLSYAIDAKTKLEMNLSNLYWQSSTRVNEIKVDTLGDVKSIHVSPSLTRGNTATLSWIKKHERDEMKARVFYSVMDMYSDNTKSSYALQNSTTSRFDTSNRRITNSGISTDLKKTLADDHTIKLGAGYSSSKTTQENRYLVNGVRDPNVSDYGDTQEIKKSLNLYFQDEWNASENLAFNAGLSHGLKRYEIKEGATWNTPSYHVLSPSIHTAYKINGDEKEQIRVSIARSFSEPGVSNFIRKPSPHISPACRMMTPRFCLYAPFWSEIHSPSYELSEKQAERQKIKSASA